MMRRLCYILVLLFTWTALSHAQGYYMELPYENVNGKLIVEAEVEGHHGRFVFDTGAPFYISHALWQKLGKGDTRDQGIIDAAGHRLTVQKTVVKRLHLGGENGFNYDGVPANIIPAGNMIEALGIDGIIGCDIMPQSVVRFDSRRSVIIITDDVAPFNISVRNRMKMETNAQNCPFVEVNVGRGVIETPLFDSGSAAFYAISAATAAEGMKAGSVEKVADGYGTTGFGLGGESAVTEKQRVKVLDLRLGSGKFRNLVTETSPGGTLIGTAILKYGVVTLDYAHGAFYYEPFEQQPVDLSEKHWNLDITYDQGNIRVAGAWDNLRQQVTIGDRLVAVDGKELQIVTLEEAMKGNLLKIKKDTAKVMLEKRDGTRYSVTIEKK